MKSNVVLSLLSLSILCLSSCGDPAKNCDHSYKFVGAKSATCTEKGMKTHYECTKCGSYFSNPSRELIKASELTTPALGHTFVDNKVLVEPTCKKDGVEQQKCVRCDATQEVAIPKYNDHVFNQKVMEDKYLKTAGDCDTKDIYYYSCGCGESSCNHSGETFEGYERHNLTKHDAREPQGSTPGNSEYYTCSVCERIFTKNEDGTLHEEAVIPEYQGNIKLNKKNGAVLDIVNKTVEQYLKVVDDPATESNEIAEYIFNHVYSFGNCSPNKDVTLSWKCTNEARAPYTVTLYKDEALTKPVNSYETSETFITFRNMIPGTYYYQVTDSAATKNYSLVDSFSFNSHLRAIYTKDNIKNMRDLGGWSCEGGTIKYGMLYRSAAWETCGTSGDEILDDLGIKSEIDIRLADSNSDYAESQHPRDNIDYYHLGVTDVYGSMVSHTQTLNDIFGIFTLLSREASYPVDYHCAAGADRTGFVSVLIEGLLGMSNEDIYRDYELTSWYHSKRLRGDVSVTNGVYSFDSTGNCDHGSWVSNIMQVINGLLKDYGDGTGNISSAARKFLLNKVNLSEKTLNSVKANLIEVEE